MSSRKFSKLLRNEELLASARTIEISAVNVIVRTRTRSVGWMRLKESEALISVRDPPYRFSAQTETRPSAEKIRMIAPNPSKTRSPASCRDGMASKLEPAHAASPEPIAMIHSAPSPLPPYVQ